MKYFVFSDVHGDYPALMSGLSESGYDPKDKNHTIISCGDNFGEGNKAEGCLGIFEFLTSKQHFNPPICLRGNHENLLLDIYHRGYLDEFDFQCGEDKTLKSFLSLLGNTPSLSYSFLFMDSVKDILKGHGVIDWILKMPYYFRTKHFLFLHSFFPYDKERNILHVEDYDSASEELWEKVVWVQTPPLIDKFLSLFPNGIKLPDGKYLGVVFGHWSVAGLHKRYDGESGKKKNSFDPFVHRGAKLIGLDASTPLSHKVNVLVVEDQSL